jgi:hypothetical protein
MNAHDHSGKSLLQRFVDYRNRAEELRIQADSMHEGPAVLMLSVAASYDSAAETVQAIMLQSGAVQL